VRIHACALLLQRLQGHLHSAAFPVPHNSNHYGIPHSVFVQDIHKVTRRLYHLSSNTDNDITQEDTPIRIASCSPQACRFGSTPLTYLDNQGAFQTQSACGCVISETYSQTWTDHPAMANQLRYNPIDGIHGDGKTNPGANPRGTINGGIDPN
jgi:hypothetical protein